MSTSSTQVRAERSELVCKRTDGDSDGEEVTFFERDRDPDERTTRWITVRAADCVPADEWR
ncbi:DUF7511 domain-containing protein [Halorubrum salsamenti]|uniref:DUF7511 domain-containing protein n=1 Tax=Halorubrum salsamenti TaxID=2583990 RepID=UPI0011A81C5C|nr:hypothetical protein [Halorubrum salsamenti]